MGVPGRSSRLERLCGSERREDSPTEALTVVPSVNSIKMLGAQTPPCLLSSRELGLLKLAGSPSGQRDEGHSACRLFRAKQEPDSGSYLSLLGVSLCDHVATRSSPQRYWRITSGCLRSGNRCTAMSRSMEPDRFAPWMSTRVSVSMIDGNRKAWRVVFPFKAGPSSYQQRDLPRVKITRVLSAGFSLRNRSLVWLGTHLSPCRESATPSPKRRVGVHNAFFGTTKFVGPRQWLERSV